MEFDFEVRHRPGRKTMVADASSQLQSDNMNETYPNADIAECYVEYFGGVFSMDTVDSIEHDVFWKWTIDDLKKDSIRMPPVGVLWIT